MSVRPMEWRLATINASSPAMSHAVVKTKDTRIGVICLSASSAPHFLLARLQGYSFQFVFQVVFPAYTLSVSCRLLSRHSVRTSWEFSLEEVGISQTCQVTHLLGGRMKVPPMMPIRPMECWLATLNASSPTMAHALEQINAARIGVICQGASSAPHFLLARLQGHSFQFVFQLVFPTFTLQPPSCVLPTAFKTFCSKKLGILSGSRWHFSNVSSDITVPPAHESTSLDVNKDNVAKHSTLDVGAFGIRDKAAGAGCRAMTIMHKHMWSVGAAACHLLQRVS